MLNKSEIEQNTGIAFKEYNQPVYNAIKKHALCLLEDSGAFKGRILLGRFQEHPIVLITALIERMEVEAIIQRIAGNPEDRAGNPVTGVFIHGNEEEALM